MVEIAAQIHLVSLFVTIGAAFLLAAYLGLSLLHADMGLWPASEGWRHHLAFGLFRLFCGGTVVFALAEVGLHGWGHWARYAVGVPITLMAFGATLRGYHFLGLDNTYCETDGLVTGGMYEISRNPQYVTSVLATIGLGIATGSPVTLIFAATLFALYHLFVLNEERWLLQNYGQPFRDYMSNTPRFVDARSVARILNAQRPPEAATAAL